MRLQCCQFSDRLRIAGSDFRRCGRSGFLTRSRRLAGRSGLSGLRLDVGEAEVCSEVCSGAAGGRGFDEDTAWFSYSVDGESFTNIGDSVLMPFRKRMGCPPEPDDRRRLRHIRRGGGGSMPYCENLPLKSGMKANSTGCIL